MYTLLLAGIAAFPVLVIMIIVMANAKAKREPFKKIFSVMLISGISVIPAIILETVGSGVLSLFGDVENPDIFTALIDNILVVAFVEEACKYFTFKWMIFQDREFDNTYDGLIYGAASALGFALVENFMYVFESGFETGILRAVLSVPLHATTGIVMGWNFGVDKYRRYNNIPNAHKPERTAFVFMVLLHGLYDFFCDYSFVIVMLCGVLCYVLIIGTIVKGKKKNFHIYNRYYYEMLGGAYQDQKGGKTKEKSPSVFGIPMSRSAQPFDPYHPPAMPQNWNASQPVQTVQPMQAVWNNSPQIVQPQQAPSAFKFCLECGTKIPRDAEFCTACGTRQTTTVSS